MKHYYYLIILTMLSFAMCTARMCILLSSALSNAHHEFRKRQYIAMFERLRSFGYTDPYVVEALAKYPTFLDEYTSHVCYSTANNPSFTNQGTNEGRTVLQATFYFNFDPDDMILKVTGRYHFLSDYFIKIVEENADNYDAIIKTDIRGNVYTLCYAMKCKHIQDMFAHMDFVGMERHNINLENAVGNYIKTRVGLGNFEVLHVNKLDVEANIYGSTAAPGAPWQILTY